MADAFDSKSNGETRGGSSPLAGIIYQDLTLIALRVVSVFLLAVFPIKEVWSFLCLDPLLN